ncbi:multidrug effflux MFS transporter [Gordonia soli]|uniref:Putative drug resistance transporter n=1 Tax=Gordonia soli NBRC 108243 TaxID=1223545 RepID=M0QNR4_9ACTN|nr:multidrug effflux MFS transporter [Gordonia soli]GAC70049.1 putative drug resistance transporter [Gordonia soli NBRC 108243]
MTDPIVTSRSEAAVPPIMLIALALLAAVPPLATDMYLPGFPAMADEFRTSPSTIQLTLTTFMIGLAIGQLIIGPISDRLGRRHLLLAGTSVCIAASVACALAPNVEFLLVFRFLQGFTGAAGIVLGRAVISDRAHGAQAAKAFSVVMAINGIAPVAAPLLGGVIIEQSDWHVVFWVLTALAVAMLLGVILHIGESHPPELRSTGGIGSVLTDLRAVVTDRRYLGYTITFVFGFGSMFSYIAASPFVFQDLFGLSTIAFSTVFACNAIGLIAANILNAKLVDRLGARMLLQVGLGVLVVFTAALVVATLADAGLAVTVVLLWVAVSSVGLVMANGTALAVEQTRRTAGSGSAVLGAAQFGLAAAVSPLVGIGGAATAVPMVVTMLGCALIAVAGLALTRGRAGQRAPEAT